LKQIQGKSRDQIFERKKKEKSKRLHSFPLLERERKKKRKNWIEKKC
jgi:hypothetical protein